MKHRTGIIYSLVWVAYILITAILFPYLRVTVLLLSIPLSMAGAWLYGFWGAALTTLLSIGYHALMLGYFDYESPTVMDAFNPLGIITQLFVSGWTALLKRNRNRYRELSESLEHIVEEQTKDLRLFTDALLEGSDAQRHIHASSLLTLPLSELESIHETSHSLEQKLRAQNHQELKNVEKVTQLIQNCIAHLQAIGNAPEAGISKSESIHTALTRLANHIFTISGATIQLSESSEWKPLPQSVAPDIYHIIHEALTNAIRHAHPTQIKIEIQTSPEQHAISITNNGQSWIPSTKKGMGIALMKHRAHKIGATLTVQGGARLPTAITCTLPTQLTTTSLSA